MEETKKPGNRALLIIIPVAVLVIIALIVGIVINKNKDYRIIKVFEVDGTATVTREKVGDIEPYNNMLLESGDTVFLDTGTMSLKLDEDKYVYVEEQTKFRLEATGNSENSRTSIQLEQGAITNEIQNKLSDDSSYEVNTPNSTMSVRGTIYRVCVYEENGVHYTRVSVFEGTVATRLVYPDGTVSEKETLVDKGKEILIYEDGTTTDYVGTPSDIDYSTLPDSVIKCLIEIAKGGSDLGISIEELEKYLQGPFTVTFMYNGAVFGTQEVQKDACAGVPVLMPEASGTWNFDFSQPITEDTEIQWK